MKNLSLHLISIGTYTSLVQPTYVGRDLYLSLHAQIGSGMIISRIYIRKNLLVDFKAQFFVIILSSSWLAGVNLPIIKKYVIGAHLQTLISPLFTAIPYSWLYQHRIPQVNVCYLGIQPCKHRPLGAETNHLRNKTTWLN